MIRIDLLFAAACSVVSALPMSPSQGFVTFRQPFRPNRMEPTPFAVAPGGDADFPAMRFQPEAPGSSEDDSVEKEAKINFAKVLNDIKHLPMPQEAESGEENDSVGNDSIKKDAGLRPVGEKFETTKRLEAETSAAPAKPTEAVLEGETEEEGSKANGVEEQDEEMCAITMEMLEDLQFEKFIPVAKHVDKHGHVDGVAGEVIIGNAIVPIAEAVGVVPCKELLKHLQPEHEQMHQHRSIDRQYELYHK